MSEMNYNAGAASEKLRNAELPSNIEAEKAVLSACLLSEEAADEICIMLTRDNFYRSRHRDVFDAIFSLVKDGKTSDLISVRDKLNVEGKFTSPEDQVYLVDLQTATNSLSSWRNHAEIVKRKSIQRDLIKASAEINAIAYDGPDSISEVVGLAEQKLFNVTEKRVSQTFRSMEDLCEEASAEIAAIAKRKGEILGVPTGFKDVDRLFCGFRGGDLVILAARPGVGKTSFALNMAVNSAKRGTNVAFFSLEMSALQITQRIISSEANVKLSNIRSGYLQDSDIAAIGNASVALSSLSLAIDDTPGLSILEARAKARRQLRNLKERNDLGMIVVDYLQLMTPATPRRDGNRAVEVGEISRGLKILAKELDVPVIALSQLNRSVETRGTKYKRPMLSDLRESGSIEQDADVVMFIDRSMDEKEAEETGRPDLGTAELQVAKHRNGPTKDITLTFVGENTKFTDFTDGSAYPETALG